MEQQQINIHQSMNTVRDERVPITMARRALRLRMEEQLSIWRVAANILNKQLRTADKGWSSSLGFGRGANKSSPYKLACYET
jgi:hypothetical protein